MVFTKVLSYDVRPQFKSSDFLVSRAAVYW